MKKINMMKYNKIKSFEKKKKKLINKKDVFFLRFQTPNSLFDNQRSRITISVVKVIS